MTALFAPSPTTTATGPDPRRLVPAAIVASIGAVVLSIAFSRFVVGSRPDFPAAVASDARSLVGAVPWLALIGILHLLVAGAIASGSRRIRTAALRTVAIGAVAAAVLGIVALAGAAPGPVSFAGLAAIATLYGVAAIVGARAPRDV
jgi:hypothetical protein